MTKATDTIATSRTTFHPPTACQARSGDVIYVDGITRGLRWNRLTDTADELGITAPVGGPTMATGSAGSFTYITGYRYVDRDRRTTSSL